MSPTKPILVTGAAGYMASWVVARLLHEGYKVHGTVRSLQDKNKIQHLLELAQRYSGRLELFEADLMAQGSFDAAMAGCATVIHTASPYFLDKPKAPQTQLIGPAREGTLNVLESVNRTLDVTRVVLTSSVAALYNDACDVGADAQHTVQESNINPNQDIGHNTYAYSKTIAEQAAWELHSQQKRWELVTIHPGAIFGPSLSRRVDATSVTMMIQFLNGSFRTGVPKLWLGLVDVRDVAEAHVRAALLSHASKRYIVVAESLRMLEIASRMRPGELGIPARLPRKEVPKALIWLLAPFVGMQRRYVARNVNFPLDFNNARSKKELGLTYRDTAETLNEHCRQIVADGLLYTAGAATKCGDDEKHS